LNRFRIVASILALACCLRLGLFLIVAPHPERFFTPDAYDTLGRNFVEVFGAGAGELFEAGLQRTPGYPLLIHSVYALVGAAPAVVVLVQIAFGVATVWLTYLAGLRLFDRQAAWLAALALAVDPISIIMTNYLQPEVFFTFVLVAGSLCWWRMLRERSLWWSAGAGMLLGASTLIRPIALYLPVVLVSVGLILQESRWSTRLLRSGVFLLAFALPVGGWIARNYALTGVPIFTTVESINLLNYRAAPAMAEEEHISIEEAERRLSETLKSRTPEGMNRGQISRLEASLAFETLAQYPRGTVVTFIKGVGRLLAGPGRAELLRLLGAPRPTTIETGLHAVLVGMETVVLGLILFGAVLGGYRLLRSRRYIELVAVLIFIFYFVAISAGLEAYSRFRAPIMPYFALLAGCAFASRRGGQGGAGLYEGMGIGQRGQLLRGVMTAVGGSFSLSCPGASMVSSANGGSCIA
jgi:4-amino-4-deoxy-L-arabinose transferase-like glycosyltransferase